MITTIKLTLKSVFGRQANYSKKKKKKEKYKVATNARNKKLITHLFVFCYFRLISSHRGFLFFVVRTVHYRIFFFKYISLKYQRSSNYFPILFRKIQGKRKEKEILEILASYEKKKLQI